MRPARQTVPSIARWLVLAAVLAQLSCSGSTTTAERKHSLLVFGTLLEITLYDVSDAGAAAAFDRLEQDFHAFHASWTPWEESNLSRINDAIRADETAAVSADLLPMIRRSQDLYASSDGLFNPAIGNLINLWQMHRHEEDDIRPPDASEITRILAQDPRMSDLSIDGSRLRSSNPGVQLSLGAFAKGYAIDLAMDYLRSQGISQAIINAGGDLRVIGQRGDRRWRIGIRHPREDGVIAWLEADSDESVFTSGDYERFYMYQGRRYHHILDPRTGYPAMATTSVTVIHENAGTADAAATALFVAGPDRWYEIARSMGIRYVMLIDADGRLHMNPAMKRRLHLTNPETSHIVLSQPL